MRFTIAASCLLFFAVLSEPTDAQVNLDIVKDLSEQGLVALEKAPRALEELQSAILEGKEYPSNRECLGALQVLTNGAKVLSNLLPFSTVAEFEDDRGPVGRSRILLNGEKVHLEAYCDRSVMRAKSLPWGAHTGLETPSKSGSLDAIAGAILLTYLQQKSLDAEVTETGNQCDASELVSTLGGDFELIDSKGEIVNIGDVITEPSLVYFGYTFCPDVCPLDNSRNATAVDILKGRGVSVTPVFISIDPKRDTPSVVGNYARIFHSKMVGLTGTPEQVKAASQAYKTYYKVSDPSSEYYLVDHSTFTYVVHPEKGVLDYLRRGSTAEEVAEKVECLLSDN